MNRLGVMGKLTASLAHEITQPIASARNNARAAQNFLDMQPPDLSEVREALSCVVDDPPGGGAFPVVGPRADERRVIESIPN